MIMMQLEKMPSLTSKIFQEEVVLLPGTNEMFELELAYMEYNSLHKSEFLNRTAYIKSINGVLSNHYQLYSIPKILENSGDLIEDGSNYSSGYASHGLFPYRGKFHPQLVKALFNIVGVQKGETVLDPMAGSGTTNIEASLMGFNSYAIDISPFCQFMIQTKYQALSIKLPMLEYLPSKNKELFDFYSKGDVFARLDSINDVEKRKVYNLAFLAYLDALGYSKRVKMSGHEKLFERVLAKYYLAIKTLLLNKYYSIDDLGNMQVLVNSDAMRTDLPDNGIDCVVTSPPYSFAIDYMENDRDQLKFLGCNPDEIRNKMIGLKGKSREEKLNNYFNDMNIVCAEIARVLKNGKYFIMIIGSNTNQTGGIRLENTIIKSAESFGMPLVHSLLKPIRGMRNTMKEEFVLIFRKEH